MKATVLIKALILWFVLLLVAVGNGAVRDLYLTQHFSEMHTHQIGSITASLLILAATTLCVRWLHLSRTPDLLLVGLFWLVLTLLFEFGFFHYGMKHPWHELLANYDVLHGRLWVLVLTVTFLSPWLGAKIAGL